METIYNVYIGDYHYETCIDELGLCIILDQVKRDARIVEREVLVKEVSVPFGYIGDLQGAKYKAAEKRWKQEDKIYKAGGDPTKWKREKFVKEDTKKFFELLWSK